LGSSFWHAGKRTVNRYVSRRRLIDAVLRFESHDMAAADRPRRFGVRRPPGRNINLIASLVDGPSTALTRFSLGFAGALPQQLRRRCLRRYLQTR
jgi:hypothetical protein